MRCRALSGMYHDQGRRHGPGVAIHHSGSLKGSGRRGKMKEKAEEYERIFSQPRSSEKKKKEEGADLPEARLRVRPSRVHGEKEEENRTELECRSRKKKNGQRTQSTKFLTPANGSGRGRREEIPSSLSNGVRRGGEKGKKKNRVCPYFLAMRSGTKKKKIANASPAEKKKKIGRKLVTSVDATSEEKKKGRRIELRHGPARR